MVATKEIRNQAGKINFNCELKKANKQIVRMFATTKGRKNVKKRQDSQPARKHQNRPGDYRNVCKMQSK